MSHSEENTSDSLVGALKGPCILYKKGGGGGGCGGMVGGGGWG